MDEIYKQAVEMQHKLRDYVDRDGDPAAVRLKNEVQRLTDEIEARKNPRSIEDRVKSIIRQLEALADPVMGAADRDDLRDRCLDMQQDLRKAADY